MFDIILEFFRAIPVLIIFIILLAYSRDESIRKLKGWSLIIIGFGLILFGVLIDITDNFPSLDKYILIGDTQYQAFLEKVVGYLLGFFLLALGFSKWLPLVMKINSSESDLRDSEQLLNSIFRSAPIGIGLVVNRVFQWTNERISEMTGYSSKELLHQSSRIVYPSDKEFEWVGQKKYKLINEYGTGSVETKWQRKEQ